MASSTVQVATISVVKGVSVPLTVRAAMRRGVWAVTPFIGADNEIVPRAWGVTHVPSGIKAMLGSESLANCRRLCSALNERLPDFGERAPFGVKPRKMTSARWDLCREIVVAWYRECAGFVDGRRGRG